jgi:chromosome segregation protein
VAGTLKLKYEAEKKDREELEDQVAFYKKDSQGLQHRISLLESEGKKNKKEISGLTNKLNQMAKNYGEIEELTEREHSRMQELEQELKRYADENFALVEELEKRNGIEAELQLTQVNLTETQQLKQELDRMISKLESERKEMEQAFKAVDHSRTRLESENKSLAAELHKISEDTKELNKSVKKYQVEAFNLELTRKEKDEQVMLVEELKTELEKKELEIKEGRKQIEEMKSEIVKYKSKLDTLCNLNEYLDRSAKQAEGVKSKVRQVVKYR